MKKTFKFSGNYNSINNNPFLANTSSTNYSQILDDIILTDVIKKNDYLFKPFTKNENADYFLTHTYPYTKNEYYFGDPKLNNAIKFITNYKKYNKKYNLPYIIGKCYTLSDGTPIVFYENNIQIGYDFYDYDDFLDTSFLKNLSTNKKKIIIDIYIKGAKNIDINIL